MSYPIIESAEVLGKTGIANARIALRKKLKALNQSVSKALM